MLERANRVTAGIDFRRIVRGGRRVRSGVALAHARRTATGAPFRFGIIVARPVGGAVDRNRVRRRMRAVGRALAAELSGVDVVVRANPGAAGASWDDLARDVRRAVHRSVAATETP